MCASGRTTLRAYNMERRFEEARVVPGPYQRYLSAMRSESEFPGKHLALNEAWREQSAHRYTPERGCYFKNHPSSFQENFLEGRAPRKVVCWKPDIEVVAISTVGVDFIKGICKVSEDLTKLSRKYRISFRYWTYQVGTKARYQLYQPDKILF